MSARFDADRQDPEALQVTAGLQADVTRSGIEPALLELVKIRVSRINGCAFRRSMHLRDARRQNKREALLDLLPAWREAPRATARGVAGLTSAELATSIADGHVPGAVHAAAQREFGDKEQVDLSSAVVAIGGWNWSAIPFRKPPEAAGAAAQRSSRSNRTAHAA
ncbi:MAG TPA: carboxymuconolactone decarboxylase family protein [Acetobacteraceae bacterium]|nr:carboxymuconolactone decarboxylase family protein [Acetobacteraceae bacterium]